LHSGVEGGVQAQHHWRGLAVMQVEVPGQEGCCLYSKVGFL
jgi:hypothetical protein